MSSQNSDKIQGTFWQRSSIKGAQGTYLSWTLFNLFRTADKNQKGELSKIMRENGFEQKYQNIRKSLSVRKSSSAVDPKTSLMMLDYVHREYKKAA